MVTRKSCAGGVTLSHTKQNRQTWSPTVTFFRRDLLVGTSSRFFHSTCEFFQLTCCLGMGQEYSRALWNLWFHGFAKGEGGIVAIGAAGKLGRFLWKALVWAVKMQLFMSINSGSALATPSLMASAPWGVSVERAIKAIMWCRREPGLIS